MKKYKIITPIITASAIIGTTIPLAVSVCGKNTTSNQEAKNNINVQLQAAAYVKFTFDANGGTMKGETVFRVKSGKTFGTLAVDNPEWSGKTFGGWYKEASCTNQWLATDVINSTTTNVAYAKWVDAKEFTINFTATGSATRSGTAGSYTYVESKGTATITGGTTYTGKTGTTWGNIVKPFATNTVDGECVEYVTRTGSAGSYSYTAIDSTTTIDTLSTATIVPAFAVASVIDIDINDGVDEIVTQNTATTAFTATVKDIHGTVVSPTVTWGVYDDTTTTTASTKASLDANHKLVAATVTAETTVYVRATCEGVSTNKKVTIHIPTYQSTNMFTQISNTWYELSGVNGTGSITSTKVGTTSTTDVKTRAQFDYPVYFGDYVTETGDSFLADCSVFGTANGTLNFGNSKITSIGDSFLDGCTKFNAALTLPATVRHIGDFFMNGCTIFNSALTLNNGLKVIGGGFLAECPAFGQNLTMPASITNVGTDFLAECAAMNGKTITLSMSDPDLVFAQSNSTLTFATAGDFSITIAGIGKTAFIAKFSDIGTTGSYTRHLVAAA